MIVQRHWRIALTLTAAGLLLATACQSPAPAPTAAPAAPKAAAPAAQTTGAVANKLALMVDVVQGSKNLTDEQKKDPGSCLLTSKFPRNSQIVWRARVLDPRTGDPMDKEALKGAQIKLANGTNIDMKYGPHGADPNKEDFWTGSWVIPKDYATGTLNFSIVATAADGRTGEFLPFRVPSSLLTITDKVLPDVVVPAKPAT